MNSMISAFQFVVMFVTSEVATVSGLRLLTLH